MSDRLESSFRVYTSEDNVQKRFMLVCESSLYPEKLPDVSRSRLLSKQMAAEWSAGKLDSSYLKGGFHALADSKLRTARGKSLHLHSLANLCFGSLLLTETLRCRVCVSSIGDGNLNCFIQFCILYTNIVTFWSIKDEFESISGLKVSGMTGELSHLISWESHQHINPVPSIF